MGNCHSIVGFVVATLASVVFVGCSSEVGESSPAPGTVPVIGEEPVTSAPVHGGPGSSKLIGSGFESESPTGPKPFACRAGAFCEDFELEDLTAHWTDHVEVGGGALGFASASASPGRSALVVDTREASDAAFVWSERGAVDPTWSGAFEVAMRVDRIPSEALGGPEIVVKSARDGLVTLALVAKPEGLFLEQRGTSECLRDRCVAKSTFLGPISEGVFAKVSLGFEVDGTTKESGPYGRIEWRMNGGELNATDLTVPLLDGTTVLRAGVTKADARAARLALDDISLFTR